MRSRSQSTPNFHPEFGYLCPSRRMRGGVRVAVAFITLGMMLGGTMALLGFADRSADASDRILAAAIDDVQPGTVAGNFALATTPPGSAMPATFDAEQRATHAERDCNDLVSSYLDHGCRASGPRKRHAERLNHRVATVVIGSVRTPSPGAEAVPVQPAGMTAIAPPSAIPLPVARPTATMIAAAQKPKAIASRDLDPSHRDAAISAYARADERVANANLPRTNGLPSLFGGLFGLR